MATPLRSLEPRSGSVPTLRAWRADLAALTCTDDPER
jgi:hypothetical protein